MRPGNKAANRFAGLSAWNVLHRMGNFAPGTPATMRAALHRGQLSVEQLVDRYSIRNQSVRQLLIDYFARRSSDCDYASLSHLVLELAHHFWEKIERINPQLADLRIAPEVYATWRQLISTRDDGTPRAGVDGIVIIVRSFYFDLHTWAADEPERWDPGLRPARCHRASCTAWASDAGGSTNAPPIALASDSPCYRCWSSTWRTATTRHADCWTAPRPDRERVIPMSAELFHVIAAVIRRHTRGGRSIPLVSRFDHHDKLWSAPLPFLFQRQVGSTRSVIAAGTVLNMLKRRCQDLAEHHPAFRSIRFTPHDFRRIFATELVNSGLPIHIGAALLGHLNLQATRGYAQVTAKRTRAAVDQLAAFQFDGRGNRIWRQARALLKHEHQRHAVGQVAVPFGICTEPSNVQAGGHACPFRFRCVGCGHFRSDPSYLPELRGYLDTLLRNRERVRAAIELEEWARAEATPSDEEISRVRALIRRIETDLERLSDDERRLIDEACRVVRATRQTVQLGMPTIRPPDLDPHLTPALEGLA